MTTTAAVQTSSQNAAIATAGAEARAVDVPLTVDVGSGATLEMVTYKDADHLPSTFTEVGTSESGHGTAGWYHAYYDGSANRYQKTKFTANADYLAVTVTITGQEYTDGDGKTWAADALNGKAVDVVVKRKSVDGKINRANFYGASTSAAVSALPSDMTDVDTDGTYTVAANLTLASLESTGTVCYFGLFVEGEKGSSGADADGTIIGDFIVEVSAH